MSTFFQETRIEYWQGLERKNRRLAFENSRQRTKLNALDHHRIRPARRDDLFSVNSYSRVHWGRAVCEQLARFFCDGGNGQGHNREILFVTLCDRQCVRLANDELVEKDLNWIKNRLRYGLRGLNYFATIEPAFYVNWQSGFGSGGAKRCISWHLHALVWGISKEQLRKRLRKLRREGRYEPLGRGLKPTQVKLVKQGRLPRTVAYLLKSPRCAYRVSMVDWVRKGIVVTDADGVVQQSYSQKPSKLRPGERLTLYFVMRQLRLNDLTIAGGEGSRLLRATTRLCA